MSFQTKIITLSKAIRHVKNWPVVINRQMLARGSGPAKLRFRNGLTASFRPETADWEMVKEVMLDGAYAHAFDYLEAQQSSLPILDLGANLGFFSLRAAQCSPASAIYAYEPAPKNVAQMKLNLSLNPGLARRIQVFAEAVGGSTRQADFFFDEEAPQASRLAPGAGGSGRLPVTVRAFADILNNITPAWALVKIDVEGAEYEIFEQTPAEAWQGVRALALEIHHPPTGWAGGRAGLLAHVQALGFVPARESSGGDSYFFHRPN